MNKEKNPLLDPEVIKKRIAGYEEAWANLAIEDMHTSDSEKEWFIDMIKRGFTDDQILEEIDDQLKRELKENGQS